MIDSNIRILLVEDSAEDAELILKELKRAGISFDARRVEVAVDYRRELEAFRPHVILSDFSMPHFDGMEALRTASQSFSHIPFIFVSGTLGEEYAVRALKSGARDYVLKSNLVRLPAAVDRAIKETEERRARQALEHQLRESEKLYRILFQNNPHPTWAYDIETLRLVAVNAAAVARYGFSVDELLAMDSDNKPASSPYRTKSGEPIVAEIRTHDLVLAGRSVRIAVAGA